jgi:hypothetical protein
VPKTVIKAGAELDLLNADELRTVLSEVMAGQTRPRRHLTVPSGVALDANGLGTVKAYRVETGYRFALTRLEVTLDGTDMASPYNPGAAGAVDVYVDGRWRDGVPIGGSTGYILPVVLTTAPGQAIVCDDDALIEVRITGGPASTGALVTTSGLLDPIDPSL